ncbi:MAG: Gfo/Idh/MocA family oxidoreductase [Anaerolineales bacterium]|nr:Gfo/Idh/MocA family oxidoreductase [Anaerolineales bacterium]
MPIRVGVIGLNASGQMQVAAFKENPRYEVVAVCTRLAEQAEAFAREHHIPRWYTDPRLVINSDVDLISIATAPSTHAGLVAAALARRRHVLSEIAFMPSTSDARVVNDLLKNAHCVGVTAFALRYKPHLRLITDMLAQQALGPVQVMCFDYFSDDLTSAPGATGALSQSWMWDAEKGGGVLASYVAHALDIAMQWFGPIRDVEATLTTLSRRDIPTGVAQLADDTGHLTLHFESGVLGLFRYSAATALHRIGMELHGTEGSLLVEGFGDEVSVIWRNSEAPQTLYPPTQYLEETRGHSGLAGALTVFLERLGLAISEGRLLPDLPTFADGLRVTQVVDALRKAAQENRRVAVSEI